VKSRLRCAVNISMDREFKSYFDSKFLSLMKETDKKRKREHEFKYKANKKQYEFNSTLKEDLERFKTQILKEN